VVSFELDADLETTGRFVDALQIPYIGPSLGGTESLVIQVAVSTYYDMSSEERAALGISDSLVRLAVGIENAEDLIADLARALDRVFGTTTLLTASPSEMLPFVLREQLPG